MDFFCCFVYGFSKVNDKQNIWNDRVCLVQLWQPVDVFFHRMNEQIKKKMGKNTRPNNLNRKNTFDVKQKSKKKKKEEIVWNKVFCTLLPLPNYTQNSWYYTIFFYYILPSIYFLYPIMNNREITNWKTKNPKWHRVSGKAW